MVTHIKVTSLANEFNEFIKPTRDNKLWTLPHISKVVDLFRIKCGNVTQLLQAITDQPADQAQLLFLIQEELEKEENKEEKKRWRKYQLIHMRSQLTLGTEKVMGTYSLGNLDKHQFVKDLGKNILPDLFDPTKASASTKDLEEDQLEKELAELEDGDI